ncbi:MAG: hypothetical protein ABGY95_09580 [Rubritalea sp.]|uniref:hypothetical protein n=1 Tax=Rubritalea sp. TaxID=2109375 RepID=UPI003242A138
MKDVIALSGLGDIKSLAKSSTFKKDIWLNQAYIETGGSNKGFFFLLGGKVSKFKAPTMSPKGTDLAFQLTLDLSKSPELIRSLAATMGESEQADSELKKDIEPLGITIEDALKKSNATLTPAIDFDQNSKLDLGEISMGRPAIVGRIDGLNWIWDKLGDKIIESNGLPMTRTEDAGVVTYKLLTTFKDMIQGYLPFIVVDNNKD